MEPSLFFAWAIVITSVAVILGSDLVWGRRAIKIRDLWVRIMGSACGLAILGFFALVMMGK